jgi:hypothetical protein
VSPEKLRIAVVVPARLAAWQARCLERLSMDGVATLVLSIVPEAAETTPNRKSPERGLLSGAFWRWFERHSRALRPGLIPAALAAAPQLRLPTKETDRPGTIAGLAELRLDFVLDLSDGGLDADSFGEAIRYGLWRFWHGSAAGDGSHLAYLGRDGEDGGALRLAILAAYRGGAAVLFEGFFRRRRSALRNLDRCLLAAADCLVAASRRLGGDSVPKLHGHPVGAARRPPPSDAATLRLLLCELRSLMGFATDIFRLEIWNVGILSGPAAASLESLQARRIEWKPEGPLHRYYADPMALPGLPGILAEEYDYWSGRGRICCFDGAGWRVFRPAGLETGVHMSYPYLLAHEGDILCVPESSETGGIRLFRATVFPKQWEAIATIIGDFPAVDATLFQHDGIWWLFCGRAGELSEAHLYVWYAASPSGPWRPHRHNPVKTDVRSSRPAGPPIIVDGMLYRPAQDCSRTYGGALVLNRVLALDVDHYAEEVAMRLEPDPAGPYPDGLHTLCGHGRVTLVDGKRTCFHVTAPLFKAWAAIAHRRGRRRGRLGAAEG